ncbi:hypothetical protein [Dyella japonica]|uniref:Uncharacterized protein n=1 Tax=Dyella japonica A8 TaxID=1217721 RepID=A0A075JX06_9GAMM|nr:hypothetical protein [Dyella japonica]AIF46022.1 hypothetical protein HY57_01435 [Dyella japonica A8]
MIWVRLRLIADVAWVTQLEIALVLFALTKHGLAEMLDLARGGRSAIWVNDGLLDAVKLGQLRADGLDLTNFVNWIDPADQEAVQGAVETIREHHPNQVLYIERT